MSDWIRVGATEDFKPGEARVVEVDDTDIALFNLDGEFYALEDVCTHDGAEIASGCILGDVIECPRHGAQFSIPTGEVLTPPAYEPLHVFPVDVRDGLVLIRDDRWD